MTPIHEDLIDKLIPEWTEMKAEKEGLEKLLWTISAQIGMAHNMKSRHHSEGIEEYVGQKDTTYEDLRNLETKMKSAFNTFAKTDLAFDVFSSQDYVINQLEDDGFNNVEVLTLLLDDGKTCSHIIPNKGE